MTKSNFSLLKNKKMEWIYLIAGLFLILLVYGLLASCSVVKTDFSSNAKKEATVYYYLPESIIKIRATAKVAVVYNADSTLTDSNKILEEGFVITSEPIADTKDLLSLNYKPNALMADDIKYAVNSKGLLESINITTEDRTANIVTKLAEAPQVIFSTSTAGTKALNTIVKIKEFNTDFALKASRISNTQETIKWNITILNELGINELPKTISADFKISSPEIVGSAPTLANLINGKNASLIDEIDGILTRPLKNITLKFESAIQGADFNTSLPTNIVIADITKLIVIPVKRTAFVKRTNNIVIQDGIILKNEINKPSSVEGFVNIPINIGKAIVSIPGQLVQFRFDNTKRLDELEKTKLDYEKSVLENQKFALTKEQEIEKVKLEIQKTDLTNQIELQKLKLELQKSLLEAETKQLEAQKTLDALKKELEELKKGN
jgi:hypothetical protein